MDELIYAGNKALQLTLILSLPPVIVATLVGLLIGLFQTVTQIQEQTLPFGIKLVAQQSMLRRHVQSACDVQLPRCILVR